MTDCDVGEMFLNFMLEPKLRPFTGVNLSCLFPEETSAKIYLSGDTGKEC